MENLERWYMGEVRGFVAPVSWDADSRPLSLVIDTEDDEVAVHATKPEVDLMRCLRAEVTVRGLIRLGTDGSRAIYVHRCRLVFD